MIQKTVREAKLPNLDGLYGGKACVTHDGLEITKYPPPDDDDDDDDDDDEEESNQYYGAVDEMWELGACDLQICPFISEDDTVYDPGNTPPKNCLSIWTKWSPWGKCDKECGPLGHRIRTR